MWKIPPLLYYHSYRISCHGHIWGNIFHRLSQSCHIVYYLTSYRLRHIKHNTHHNIICFIASIFISFPIILILCINNCNIWNIMPHIMEKKFQYCVLFLQKFWTNHILCFLCIIYTHIIFALFCIAQLCTAQVCMSILNTKDYFFSWIFMTHVKINFAEQKLVRHIQDAHTQVLLHLTRNIINHKILHN